MTDTEIEQDEKQKAIIETLVCYMESHENFTYNELRDLGYEEVKRQKAFISYSTISDVVANLLNIFLSYKIIIKDGDNYQKNPNFLKQNNEQEFTIDTRPKKEYQS